MNFALPSVLKYKRSYLKHDIIAALVVTAVAIPQSLAFAIIVGLPPVTGLYTAMIAPVVFALFAFTRRAIVGPDSATTAVVASGAILIAQAGTAAHANAVAVICLLSAGMLLFMWAFRLGFLAELISRPVLVGFFAGVGLQLIISSVPGMLGLDSSGNLWQQVTTVAQTIADTNGMAFTVSILVVGMILALRKTPIPGELAGLVLAILFALAFNIKSYDVVMVGALPGGFPQFTMPNFTLEQITTLLPAAVSVALVVLAQGSAVIRSSAAKHNDKVRLNQDLFSLGLANAASALFQGYSANVSVVRTEAALDAKAKSQLVNIVSGLLIALVLLFGASVFEYMPQSALASIVFVIGFYLIKARELVCIWKTHRTEFFVATVAALGTVAFGVLQGVFIAVIVSLAERLSREYRPKDDILLLDGELSAWAVERVGKETLGDHTDGVLVYQFDGSLFFENVTYFVGRVKRAIERAKTPVRHVVIDAGAIDSIDYTAAEEIKRFCEKLETKSITIGFSHVTPNLRQQLDRFDITKLIGSRHIYATLTDALSVDKATVKSEKTVSKTERAARRAQAQEH